MKTSERILATSLDLFNLCGEPNISTIDIANEMNISPGNLYYHFRNKEDIVQEIYKVFESEMLEILDVPQHDLADIIEIWLYIKLLYEKIWQYRFFYRDINNLLSRNRLLNKKFNRLINKKNTAANLIHQQLVQSGYLRAPSQEASYLVENLVLNMMFWINFAAIRYPGETDQSLINRGVHQLMMLIHPYLSDAAQGLLNELSLSDFT